MNWLTAPIEEIAPAEPSNLRFLPDQEIWHLTLDQIESNTGYVSGKRIAPASEAGTSTYVFDDGNVLYSKLRPYLNKVLSPAEPGIATTELVPLRPRSAVVERQYLAYYLRSNHFLRFANVTVAGLKMPRIIMAKFWQHHVPLPPPSEQTRIVEILEQADKLRMQRSEANTRAARILQALFHSVFGDPITNPRGWPAERLDRLFNIVGGGTPSTSEASFWYGDIPWVSPKDMKRAVITDTEDHITSAAVAHSATRVIPKGSVLIVYRSGILAHSFPVAFAGREMALNQDMKALNTKGELLNEYLYGWLTSAKSLMLSCVKQGATVHNVDGPRFCGLQVMKPPRSLQEGFAERLKALLDQADKRDLANDRFEFLFKLLLHRAFTGELTAKWRQAHATQLAAEREQQMKFLNHAREALLC